MQIPVAAVADLGGQRAALEQGALVTPDADTVDGPDTPSVPAVRAAEVSALIERAVHSAVAPLVTELHTLQERNEDLAAQLGRERALREAAERRVRALERLPWWLRLFARS